MDIRGLGRCWSVVCLLLLLSALDVDCKRSYGLIRSRPKPNNLSIRRRQQPVQYTPQSQSSAGAHASAAKPAAPAAAPAVKPAPSAPVGPPPPYSPHPVKNVGASNAAPPPYTPYHAAAPPSYQAANYPRQSYGGVHSAPYTPGMAYPHGQPGMPMPGGVPMGGGMPHSPYPAGAGGLYNNYNPGMGPGMGYHAGGMGAGMGMGMGAGMGTGMGMGMMNGGGGGGGYGYQQKPSSLFSASNIITGLALYGAARGIGSAVGGAFGGGGGYGYGGYGGSNTQHVYLHHLNQPAVVQVQGTPVLAQPGTGAGVAVAAEAPSNVPAQPAAANASAPPPDAAIAAIAEATVAPAAPAATVTDATCTQNCTEAAGSAAQAQMPTEQPPLTGFDAYPTIHPSLFNYAGGSEEILYWANTVSRNLTLTESTTVAGDEQRSE